MDLSTIDATVAKEDTAVTVPLVGPDGKPDIASDGAQSTFTMVGTYSPRYRANERAWQAAQQDTAEEATQDAVQIALTSWSIVDWHGIESAGVAVPCTQENVRMVLERAPWLFDQARVALNRRERFFPVASAA